MKDLRHFRRNYTKFRLEDDAIKLEPLAQFNQWFQEAVEDGTFEANAMIVATVDKNNSPNTRVVLLKQVLEEGFIFYTNYESQKGIDISHNKQGSILFFWEKMERQVRIKGTIEKIPEELSDDYFNARPPASQIGAIISKQSAPLDSRKTLEDAFQHFDKTKIARPKHWGGYIVKPVYFEFWQGRANRLHDRIIYKKQNNNTWEVERIYP